jgi:Haem-dependent oxidative N-demethylase, alpha subunit-like
MFRVTRVHDQGGLGEGDSIVGKYGGRVKTVEILPTGDKWDLDVDDPMLVAGLLAEDLAIMVEGSDGQYYLRAGAICIPGQWTPHFSPGIFDLVWSTGFWRLEDKIGLPLKDIHLKGGVYQYKEKLQLSLDRWVGFLILIFFQLRLLDVEGFFESSQLINLFCGTMYVYMICGCIIHSQRDANILQYFFQVEPTLEIIRRNWYSNSHICQIDKDIAWANIHHGEEDEFDQSTHMPRAEALSDGKWQPPQATTE